jgi:hypothetical protein
LQQRSTKSIVKCRRNPRLIIQCNFSYTAAAGQVSRGCGLLPRQLTSESSGAESFVLFVICHSRSEQQRSWMTRCARAEGLRESSRRKLWSMTTFFGRPRDGDWARRRGEGDWHLLLVRRVQKSKPSRPRIGWKGGLKDGRPSLVCRVIPILGIADTPDGSRHSYMR